MDIEDLQPLEKRVKIEHICRCLKPCCKRPLSFGQVVKTVLLEELSSLGDASVKLKEPKNKEQLKDDPFLLLGYGVNAYFGSMLHLVKMFTMISLFALPLFVIYSKNEIKAFEGQPMYGLVKYTVGNLGGSSVQCKIQSVENKMIDM